MPASAPAVAADALSDGRPRSLGPRWQGLGVGWRPTVTMQRELILGLLLLICYGFFRQVPGWNEHSRYDLVLALVDDRGTRIDAYHENTGDKAFHNGHYYSDKAPGASLLAAPAYALLRGLYGPAGAERPDSGAIIQLLAFVAAGIPTMLLALLLLRYLRALVGEWWALALTVSFALGTIAFPYATMYLGHAAATAFLFAAFYLLWRHRPSGPARLPLWAGFCAGWAVLVDVGATPGVGALAVYALLRDRRAPFLMAAGAVPPALLLAGYNWVSFGSPVSLGYTNLVHPGFATAMGQGVLGVTLPKAAVLHEILLGPRGLLRLSPWLLFAPLGLWAARRPDVRREVVLCASIVLMYLVSNAGYHEPLGGWSPGPRFLITALPFATILVALAPRILRPVILILAACSVALVTVATATMPNAPTEAKDPLIEFWLPRLMTGYPAETTAWLYWGLHGSQPLLILGLAGTIAVAALWATARPTRLASGLAGVGIGTLGLLLAAFGLPVDLAGSLGLGGSAGDSRAAIAIVRAGVIPVPMDDGRPNVAPWAQLENRGRASDATIVRFAIYAPGGERVWSDSHRVAGWRAKERKRLGAQWSPRDAPPGDYRVEVMVMPPDQRRTIARMRNVATIRVFEGGYEVRRD